MSGTERKRRYIDNVEEKKETKRHNKEEIDKKVERLRKN